MVNNHNAREWGKNPFTHLSGVLVLPVLCLTLFDTILLHYDGIIPQLVPRRGMGYISIYEQKEVNHVTRFILAVYYSCGIISNGTI